MDQKKRRWSIQRMNRSHCDRLRVKIPEFRNAGRENCVCSEQDHPEFPLQEEGQSGGTECSQRRSVSSRKTDRLLDLRLLSSDRRSWYRSWLCGFILCYSSWWQHSGIRYKMGRISIVDVKNSIQWYFWKSVQIENTWVWSTQNRIKNCATWSFIIRYRCPIIRKLRTMVKRNTDQKLQLRNLTPEARELRQEQWLRVAGD